MIRGILLTILFCCLSVDLFAQTQDSVYSLTPDSLKKEVVPDTLLAKSVIVFIHCGQFKDSVLTYFILGNQIDSREIDNSIGESVGDLLQMRSFLDVVKSGPSGQPENVHLAGDGRGVNSSIDGISYNQQDLYYPQRGVMDWNTVSRSWISKIEFLPVGLASLGGIGAGVVGVDLTTKDFDTAEPYSRLTDDRGPYGYRRTVVELGRGLTSRGKLYVVIELNKSDGYLTNSDYDGLSFSGNTTFHLKKHMDIRLSAHQYKTDMGLPLFLDTNFKDLRKKESNWTITSSLLLRESEKSILDIGFLYDKQNQEIKSKSYNLQSNMLDKKYVFNVTQTITYKDRHSLRIQAYADRKSLKASEMKQEVDEGFISMCDVITMNPNLRLFLSSQLEREEGLKIGINISGGASYQIADKIHIFSTGGRFVGNPTLVDRFWLPFSASFKDTTTDYMEQGVKSLKSQESYCMDLGTRIEKNNYQINAYLFGSRIYDYIFWSNVDTTILYGHYEPMNSEAKIWGANLDLSAKFFKYVSSYLSYSFKRGENSKRNTRLPYSPDHNLFGFVQFENEYLKKEIGLKLRLETNVISERFLDEYEKDKEPNVAILNGKVTIRFLDFHFYYTVRNITNQVYRLLGDFDMPKRTFWWGFYWEFFD